MVIDAAGVAIATQEIRWPIVPLSDYPALWQDTLWQLILGIPENLRSQLGRIAIDGTSGTVLFCDAQGQPQVEPLLYNDDRPRDCLPQLGAIAPANHVVLSATSSLAKLLWWRSQQDHAGRSRVKYLLHQADWLGFLLHGQLGISDYHNCLKLGYDPTTLSYPDWFDHPDLVDLKPLLPQGVTPGQAIAPIAPPPIAPSRFLGLPKDCQICAGTTDSIAAFLASGVSQPGQGVTSLGSTLVLKLLSRYPVGDRAAGIYSHRLGDYWLVGGASNCGGAILRKFFTDQEINDLSQRINPHQSTQLDYYPLLAPGERFPINDPDYQPRLDPRPEDDTLFLQGLLESLARIEAEGYHRLAQLGASPLIEVYTAGGGAKNETWQQIRQAYLQVPVQRSPHPEAAYGAARLAQRGLSFLQKNYV
ncbi:FGGY-family carbohydrate kinase [Candidatus Synechococcus calcipolaris G9]|uniref:FGGY-family carbohydrate kinase n=1 Tax=Candidatus Synechococcus calcipolaris G9 TaxID=1497997 RepID=A0ABT6F2U2_9SYNE|nr:FGGY-family carbohydrate kinase [Candidatus Synechococcus calcipolaris]MDG2992107.1 FGGY-family carbohydrate kinase [Candidatus Synechococcus calcipolaris G9]